MVHRPPRIVVFVGPSLFGVEAAALLEADFRPPARMGDVYRLLGCSDVDAIALIDGVFHGAPSVWHRELLAAIDAGIQLFGSSSMGALRAAELDSAGMRGHGVVFGWYRDGVVTRDDEVALQHGQADSGFRPLSEPLVNIRATLKDARDSGMLEAAEAAYLINYAAGRYYSQRSLAGLLDSPVCQNWRHSRRAALAVWLRERRRDIKREDAVGLLTHLASQSLRRGQPVEALPGAYRRVALALRTIFGTSGAALLARIDARPASLAAFRRRVIDSWFLANWARDAEVTCPPARVDQERDEWQQLHGDRNLSAWLVARGLLSSELEVHLRKEALCRWLRRVGPRSFGLSTYGDDWATRRGLPPTSKWPLDREPHEFGYDYDVSVELLQFLQCTDRLSLIEEWPAKST